MYSIEYRNLICDHVLQLATSDQRILAGALVGSLALGDGDRWSDLDLTFAVADQFAMFDVLEDWTRHLVQEFDAAQLFDLPSGASIYRVFLLPGCLQFDLSFTPASKFGARGPKFRLLFGSTVEKPFSPPPSAQELFGYAVHHVLRALCGRTSAPIKLTGHPRKRLMYFAHCSGNSFGSNKFLSPLSCSYRPMAAARVGEIAKVQKKAHKTRTVTCAPHGVRCMSKTCCPWGIPRVRSEAVLGAG